MGSQAEHLKAMLGAIEGIASVIEAAGVTPIVHRHRPGEQSALQALGLVLNDAIIHATNMGADGKSVLEAIHSGSTPPVYPKQNPS